jgi:hypothetical protein
MKGKGAKQNLVLIPEKPCYPWQVLEADGETWLIVRWREKVSTHPLRQIDGVFGEEFSWDLVYNTAEKCFYRGEIAFQVTYKEFESKQKKIEVKEPWQEEYLFKESLFAERKKKKTIFQERENRIKETSFSTLLLNHVEFNQGQDSVVAESKIWKVVLPWRCWLRGKGINEQPVLKKVHVAQVGLYTLLLEALIKFERKEELDFTGEQRVTSVVPEETMFRITEGSVQEVVGLVIERALGRCFYDARSQSLFLSYLKKPFLIYVSSQKGGERFLIASNVEKDLIRIKGYADSLYPVGVEIRTREVKLGLAGEKKVFYQSKNFYSVQRELAQEKGVVHIEKSEPVMKEVAQPIKRSKPGEKWLKKKDSLSKCNLKTVMTIKI